MNNGSCYDCSQGFWGNSCEETCNCSICDRDTGKCPHVPSPVIQWFRRYWGVIVFGGGTIIASLLCFIFGCCHMCFPSKCPAVKPIDVSWTTTERVSIVGGGYGSIRRY